MSFYDRALDLYYRIRRAGYSVPVDYQRQMEELELLESQQFNIPSLTQPKLTPIGTRYIRRGGVPIRQRKLPRIEGLEQLKDKYIPDHVNELKQPKFSISEQVVKSDISTAKQDPLPKIDTTQWIGASVLRFEQQHEFNRIEQLKQPKLTPIEDNTILKPLIRTKRKSWGGVSRIYTLKVQDLTRLKRWILRRYKRPKLKHYEIQGESLKELTARLRRALSHIKYIADIKLSDATPTAVYNLVFAPYYSKLVMEVFKQDIYTPMTRAQKKAFKHAWHQGHISKGVILEKMLAKLAEYGGGDIRSTADPKAITRIVQANNLAVRRVLANLMDIVASGWEEYHQEKMERLSKQKTTVGALLNKEDVEELEDSDLSFLD